MIIATDEHEGNDMSAHVGFTNLDVTDPGGPDFYAELNGVLDNLGIRTAIRPVPVEVEDAIAFVDDDQLASYDRAAVACSWRQQSKLIACGVGSAHASPARSARCTSSGAPWTWPSPASPAVGHHATPAAGRTVPTGSWSRATPRADQLRLLAPYEVVRTSADPDTTLLAILQTTYEAGADGGEWDRQALEYVPRVQRSHDPHHAGAWPRRASISTRWSPLPHMPRPGRSSRQGSLRPPLVLRVLALAALAPCPAAGSQPGPDMA